MLIIPNWILYFQSLYSRSGDVSKLWIPMYWNLSKMKRRRWNSSVVGFVHDILTSVSSIHSFSTAPVGWFSHRMYYTTPTIQKSMKIFLAYIISDLLLILRYLPTGFHINLIHHIAIIMTWVTMIVSKQGHIFATYAQMCEITGPFINIRTVLELLNLTHLTLYRINNIIILIMWSIFRIGLFGYGGYKLIENDDDENKIPKYIITFNFFVGYILQWHWFIKIIKNVIK